MPQNFRKRNPDYDAFISYSSKDKTVANALCHFLEEKKIRCWIAPRDILPGQQYAQAIALAMSEVKVLILVYSSFSLASQWVNSETNLAVSKGKIIIPFRIEDCSFEGTAMELYLNNRHWIDAVPHPEQFFNLLAEALSVILDITPPPPVPQETQTASEESVVNNLSSSPFSSESSQPLSSPNEAKTNPETISLSSSISEKKGNCWRCDGTGVITTYTDHPHICNICKGTGGQPLNEAKQIQKQIVQALQPQTPKGNCWRCDGTGVITTYTDHPHICNICKGTGGQPLNEAKQIQKQIVQALQSQTPKGNCWRCDGTGVITTYTDHPHVCDICEGTGKI